MAFVYFDVEEQKLAEKLMDSFRSNDSVSLEQVETDVSNMLFPKLPASSVLEAFERSANRCTYNGCGIVSEGG